MRMMRWMNSVKTMVAWTSMTKCANEVVGNDDKSDGAEWMSLSEE